MKRAWPVLAIVYWLCSSVAVAASRLRSLFGRPPRVAMGSGIGIDAANFYPGEVWHSEDNGVTWSRGPIRQGGTGKTRAVVTKVDRNLGEITMSVLMSTDELKISP